MAKKGQNPLLFWIKAAFIGASLPLLLSHQSWAKDCTRTDINSNIEQFKDKDSKKVGAALNAVVQCRENAIAPLRLALSEDEPAIRAKAALALGKMGATAQDAAPVLVDTLEDSDETVRTEAVSALIQIGRAVRSQPDNEFEWWDLGSIKDLEALQESLEDALKRLKEDKRQWLSKEKKIEQLRLVSLGLQKKLEGIDRWLYQIAHWFKKYPVVWLPPVGVVLFYLGVFFVYPIFLLKLDDLVKSVEFEIPQVKFKVPLSRLLLLKYHPRVLDAWVKENLDKADNNFQLNKTVKEREIHIPIPVTLKDKTIPELSGQDLQSTSKKKRFCLLISGEGGAGKTSLACQIAKWGMADEADKRLCEHRMLPVLIEQELESQDLTKAIRGKLQDLINAVKPISEELLDNLLRQRRLIVIVDHLSEMSEATRQKIQPNSANFPVNALIVTSRLKENLGVNKTVLKPLRVQGNRLSKFMDAYLEKKGKRDLFDDEEYFDACRRLSRMVGERNITVLLARMYADQLISDLEGTAVDNLPENIPELMLSYLNRLNRTVEKLNQCKELSVQKDAQIVAWECLKQTYQPTRAMHEDVVTALAAAFKETEDIEARKQDAETRLQYLEQRLRLIQTVEPGDKIRFVLDPLAEYLAAICLVEYCRDSKEKWNEFLTSVDAVQGSLDAIQGFLLAVRDCCLVKQKKLNIPNRVPEELGKKAGLDPEAIQAAQRKRRVGRLIEDLDAPETEYRLRAVADLGAMGKDATKAIPDLYRVLEKDSEAEIRLEALKVLTQLDNNENRIIPSLYRVLEKDSEAKIRFEAFIALKQFGADYSRIPIVEIKADVWSIRLIEPPHTVKIDLGNGVTLDMVSIPGGKFMMGSPEGEGRNSEKPQHEVTVRPFFMGKYPVTQAQWKAIASREDLKIKRDLEPDPSRFEGKERPVENVSWDEAVEFCQRLSKQTGKEYRLPSEAEWEYACRAGTTTPYHFGDTITDKLANYNVDETTSVGQFSPNTFGLYDMHGLVWEWCHDDSHENYQDAPNDGRAWVTGKAISKIVRGGSWDSHPEDCRSATRRYDVYIFRFDNRDDDSLDGFRVVCGFGRT